MEEITILNVLGGGVNAPEPEDIQPGQTAALTLSLLSGIVLPVADPHNPGQPVVVPSRTYNFTLTAEAAVQIGEALVEQGSVLPKASRLAVATSLTAAERAAQEIDAMRAGR